MSAHDFSTAFTVDHTPEEAFAAITNVRGWWAEDIHGSTVKLGDEDAVLSFTKDTGEWKDTEIVFDVSKEGQRTAVRFTHVGLAPSLECFDSCSNAWSFYVNGSLRSLIATGKGEPIAKETDNAEARA